MAKIYKGDKADEALQQHFSSHGSEIKVDKGLGYAVLQFRKYLDTKKSELGYNFLNCIISSDKRLAVCLALLSPEAPDRLAIDSENSSCLGYIANGGFAFPASYIGSAVFDFPVYKAFLKNFLGGVNFTEEKLHRELQAQLGYDFATIDNPDGEYKPLGDGAESIYETIASAFFGRDNVKLHAPFFKLALATNPSFKKYLPDGYYLKPYTELIKEDTDVSFESYKDCVDRAISEGHVSASIREDMSRVCAGFAENSAEGAPECVKSYTDFILALREQDLDKLICKYLYIHQREFTSKYKEAIEGCVNAAEGSLDYLEHEEGSWL